METLFFFVVPNVIWKMKESRMKDDDYLNLTSFPWRNWKIRMNLSAIIFLKNCVDILNSVMGWYSFEIEWWVKQLKRNEELWLPYKKGCLCSYEHTTLIIIILQYYFGIMNIKILLYIFLAVVGRLKTEDKLNFITICMNICKSFCIYVNM